MISGQTMPDLKPLELVGCFFPQAKDYWQSSSGDSV